MRQFIKNRGVEWKTTGWMVRVSVLSPEYLPLESTPKAGDFLKNLASMKER